jgi:hypothetical protein
MPETVVLMDVREMSSIDATIVTRHDAAVADNTNCEGMLVAATQASSSTASTTTRTFEWIGSSLFVIGWLLQLNALLCSVRGQSSLL